MSVDRLVYGVIWGLGAASLMAGAGHWFGGLLGESSAADGRAIGNTVGIIVGIIIAVDIWRGHPQ